MFPEGPKNTSDLGFAVKKDTGTAYFKVENLWLANRISPGGKIVNHVIVSLTQKRGVRCRIDDDDKFEITGYFDPGKEVPEDGIIFRGGCTLIFDLDEMRIKYVIRKGMDDRNRIENQFRYQKGYFDDGGETYFSAKELAHLSGPFAFMHSFPQNHNH